MWSRCSFAVLSAVMKLIFRLVVDLFERLTCVYIERGQEQHAAASVTVHLH